MHLDSFLAQAFVYLLAAVVAVPLAKRLGLGSVLGYLLAGVIIGPSMLKFVGAEGGDVMHFAEFGVVMMMFIIGLELQPQVLWQLRGPILGMGGAQVLATSVVIGAAALALGFPWQQALAIGLILTMSSTAIVLQSLAEKGQMKSAAGRSAFAVLLFQDLAVIPILAVLPLLAAAGVVAPPPHHAGNVALAGWQQALLTFGAVAAIVGGGRFLVRPLFRFIAKTKLQEIFTASALMLVVGAALLMQKVGLSPAMGTFLAGVVLADSEFRHELESDLEPFKGLLLGIFFIAVGASLDLALVAAQPVQIASWVAGLIVLKMAVLFALARTAKLPATDTSLFTLALAQGGEFCFVLFSIAQSSGVLGAETVKPLTAVVAISMALTPLLLMVHEKLLLPRLQNRANARAMDEIPDHDSPVIIAGFGRFGYIVGRLLKLQGINTTVLDLDSDQVDLLRRMGLKLFYGDASRLDLLHAAGAHKARLFVLAIDDEPKALEIVDTVRHHFPNLTILARASGRIQAYELMQRGVPDAHIFRETLASSMEMAARTLRLLGYSAHEALRITRTFRDLDDKTLTRMAGIWKEHRLDSAYVNAAREEIAEMQRLLETDPVNGGYKDHAWDVDSLRQELSGKNDA